jgi:hypothetical protein
MPLLPPKAADLADGHAADTFFGEGVLDVFQLEMANDGFNLLHGAAPKNIVVRTLRGRTCLLTSEQAILFSLLPAYRKM